MEPWEVKSQVQGYSKWQNQHLNQAARHQSPFSYNRYLDSFSLCCFRAAPWPFYFLKTQEFCFFFFNYWLIALQCCADFCYTTILISHSSHSLYISSASLAPSHPIPLGYHRVLGWTPCVIQKILTGYMFYIRLCIFQCCSLNLSHPLPPRQVCSLRVSPFQLCK